MASCDTCQFDPCECCCGDFTLPNADGSGSLVASLGPCVDQLRDLEVCLGARSAIVRLVWTQWSEGVRGEGQEMLLREIPLLPLPEVSPMTSLDLTLKNIGSAEVGTLRVTKISTRYSENFLMGRAQDGTPIPQDQNFYWEIEEPDGSLFPPRRRFFPKAAPSKNELEFQWTMVLVKIEQNRTPGRGEVRH